MRRIAMGDEAGVRKDPACAQFSWDQGYTLLKLVSCATSFNVVDNIQSVLVHNYLQQTSQMVFAHFYVLLYGPSSWSLMIHIHNLYEGWLNGSALAFIKFICQSLIKRLCLCICLIIWLGLILYYRKLMKSADCFRCRFTVPFCNRHLFICVFINCRG